MSETYGEQPRDKQPVERPARKRSEDGKSAAKAGISFGAALAITISWSVHKSILLAIFHGILSWLYVIYYAATRS